MKRVKDYIRFWIATSSVLAKLVLISLLLMVYLLYLGEAVVPGVFYLESNLPVVLVVFGMAMANSLVIVRCNESSFSVDFGWKERVLAVFTVLFFVLMVYSYRPFLVAFLPFVLLVVGWKIYDEVRILFKPPPTDFEIEVVHTMLGIEIPKDDDWPEMKFGLLDLILILYTAFFAFLRYFWGVEVDDI